MSDLSLGNTEFHGYSPGVVGRIIEAHALYYHEHWGLDKSFEVQVGRELSEFMGEFRENRDCIWVPTVGGRFAGSIAMDGRKAAKDGVRLRWFLVVPEFQGLGIGKALIDRALEFSKGRGYTDLYLWTFRGLDPARSLYERNGFRLCPGTGGQSMGQKPDRTVVQEQLEKTTYWPCDVWCGCIPGIIPENTLWGSLLSG